MNGAMQGSEVPRHAVTFAPALHRDEDVAKPVSQRRVYVDGRPEWVDEGYANGTARWPGSGSTVGGTKVDPSSSGNAWSLHGARLPSGPKGRLAEPQPGEEVDDGWTP